MPSTPTSSIADTRRDQMYPTLAPAEIERVRRFGEPRAFAAGEALAKVGVGGVGLAVILAGTVDVSRHDSQGTRDLLVTLEPGAFLGELAQLAGRPALVDAVARDAVEALLIPPDQLRALLIAEAELGERIMRALILRRVRLLEIGAGGPVIVGRADNGDVLRLQGFLRRNGHPHLQLDPQVDADAKTLIERFHVDPGQLPIVLCPGGQLLHNPAETQLARCLGCCARSIPTSPTTWQSSAPGRRVLRPRSMPDRKGSPPWCSTAVRSADRPAPRHELKIISASRPASAAWR
jgi:thioredoxin reductase (NADPH)